MKLISGIRAQGLQYQPVNLEGIANPLIRKDFKAFFTKRAVRILPMVWLVANWLLLSLACIELIFNHTPLGGVSRFLRHWADLQVLALPLLAMAVMGKLTLETGSGAWSVMRTLPMRESDLILGKTLPHVLLYVTGWLPLPLYFAITAYLMPDALYANTLLVAGMTLTVVQVTAVALFVGLTTGKTSPLRWGVLLILFALLTVPIFMPEMLDAKRHPLLSKTLYMTSFPAWSRANFELDSPHPYLENRQPVFNLRGRYLINESSSGVFNREDTETVPVRFLIKDRFPAYCAPFEMESSIIWLPTSRGMLLHSGFLMICALSIVGLFSASRRTVHDY